MAITAGNTSTGSTQTTTNTTTGEIIFQSTKDGGADGVPAMEIKVAVDAASAVGAQFQVEGIHDSDEWSPTLAAGESEVYWSPNQGGAPGIPSVRVRAATAGTVTVLWNVRAK